MHVQVPFGIAPQRASPARALGGYPPGPCRAPQASAPTVSRLHESPLLVAGDGGVDLAHKCESFHTFSRAEPNAHTSQDR